MARQRKNSVYAVGAENKNNVMKVGTEFKVDASDAESGVGAGVELSRNKVMKVGTKVEVGASDGGTGVGARAGVGGGEEEDDDVRCKLEQQRPPPPAPMTEREFKMKIRREAIAAVASAAATGPEDEAQARHQGFDMDYSGIPEWLRVGPPTFTAILYLAEVIAALFWIPHHYPYIFRDFPPPATPHIQHVHDPVKVSGFCAAYMIGVLAYMWHTVGLWPLVSYTMVSWTITTVRHLGRALGWNHILLEALRFPGFVGATVTISVWWIVLVPIITLSLKPGKQRQMFHKFNFSPFLLNVHGVNWVLSVMDHMVDPRQLVLADLYCSAVVGITYLLFYLLVLDRNGHHFYVILTPRTHWCVVAYTLVLCIYVAVWYHWPLFSFLDVRIPHTK